MSGLVVDLFAGGGGASAGIERALGRRVDIAINHDPIAIAVHRANHPETLHLQSSIWEVDPLQATDGRPVDLLWASPDCTHFSVAKGDVPRSSGIRSLAWVVTRWAKLVRPRVILLENVQEFRGWGPLHKTGERRGKPDKSRAGETFAAWVKRLRNLGYVVEWRVLDASHFGAPTKRRRLFVVARCDGLPVRWPHPTHGRGLLPVRTAAECIDWSLPCPSIFERTRPLAEKTLKRIAAGIDRYVLRAARPFIVEMNHCNAPRDPDSPLGTVTTQHNRFNLVAPTVLPVNHGGGATRASTADEALATVTAARRSLALAAPTLVQTGYGERRGQAPRALDLHAPLGTVMGGGAKHALVAAFLAKHFGGVVGQDLYSAASTVTAKHRLGIVAVEGVDYQITDIGMRMLEPHELLRAQFGDFADSYDLGAARTKSAKVRLIGNSVAPNVAEALARVNCADMALEASA